jgi:hypothetical protein
MEYVRSTAVDNNNGLALVLRSLYVKCHRQHGEVQSLKKTLARFVDGLVFVPREANARLLIVRLRHDYIPQRFMCFVHLYVSKVLLLFLGLPEKLPMVCCQGYGYATFELRT